MVYIIVGALVIVLVAYKLHISSVSTLKTAVSAEVAKLEAAAKAEEPVIKAELAAVVAKIKSLL